MNLYHLFTTAGIKQTLRLCRLLENYLGVGYLLSICFRLFAKYEFLEFLYYDTFTIDFLLLNDCNKNSSARNYTT